VDQIAEDARRLRASLARLQRRLRAERGTVKLGVAKYSALGCLYRNGPMTAGQLAAHERLKPQSVTRLIAGLETEGLISRTPDAADRRRSTIAVTPAGRDALAQSVRRQEAWLARVLAESLSPTEREFLRLAVGLLDRLSDAETPATTGRSSG
jgi:DNA-binding MarR family transcriptional regulator